jgi:AcrR family transcriptional regulator
MVRVSPERLAAAVGRGWSRRELDEAIALLTRRDGSFASGATVVAPELTRAVQRVRLLAAMGAAAAAIPYRELTVEDVLARAGVSRAVFYEHFADKEGCFLAAFDAEAERLYGRIAATADGGGDWRARVRSGLEELLRFAEREPEAVYFVVVAARGSTPAGVKRREQFMERFASCLDEAVRSELERPPAAIAAAGVVGGVESVLYGRLREGGCELASLLPSLMYFAVLAFAGPEAAEEELRDDAVGFAAR